MEWYWWVLLFLGLVVGSMMVEAHEHRARHGVWPGTAPGSGGGMVCDVCGKPLGTAAARIVTPREMRLIAQNGYGEVVPVLAALPLPERQSKFRVLAYANDTDWALCGRCDDKAGPYRAGARPGGLSQSDMDEVYEHGLKPFVEAASELGSTWAGAVTERVIVHCPDCRLGHRLPKHRSGQLACARCGASFRADTRA